MHPTTKEQQRIKDLGVAKAALLDMVWELLLDFQSLAALVPLRLGRRLALGHDQSQKKSAYNGKVLGKPAA